MRLITNVHEHVFTIFACIRIEKKYFLLYLPLVILQTYPQFLLLRLLLQWASTSKKVPKQVDPSNWQIQCKEKFEKKRDGLAGGLGCLEPYLESIPQAFIQTAFFTVANSLATTATRLCYNKVNSPCEKFDVCSDLSKCSIIGYDSNNCNPVGYQPLQYKSQTEVLECVLQTRNCTLEFQKCIEPLNDCLSICQENVTNAINELDQN